MAAAITLPVDDELHFPNPFTSIKQGKFDKAVNLILGSCRDESALFTLFSFPVLGPSESVFKSFVEIGFSEHATEILTGDRYNTSRFDSPFWAMSELTNDLRWQCPLRKHVPELCCNLSAILVLTRRAIMVK
jgi:hypothetical protein